MRAAASGHSFTDIACTDGVMVRLDRMNRVLEVDRAAGQPPGYQMNAVNALVNGWLYDSDQALYGEADKWATPLEFLTKQRGDCEDYVICKYESLRRLGVPEDDMRLVTVEDMASGLAHMVLVVKSDDALHVLDNQHVLVKSPDELTLPNGEPRYRPMYAMNRNGTWLFTDAT